MKMVMDQSAVSLDKVSLYKMGLDQVATSLIQQQLIMLGASI